MGRIDPARVRLFDLPSPPPGVLDALQAVKGLGELVSDALDDLGFDGVIAASTLRPTIAGARMVGPAITLRNAPLAGDPFVAAREGRRNLQADFEAHALTRPGDVLVIEGGRDISNLGGISATMGKRQGGLGAVIEGGIRDVAYSRAIGYPVWCRDLTARTGRWRQETVEINGPVTIAGVPVRPATSSAPMRARSASSRSPWPRRWSRRWRAGRRPTPRASLFSPVDGRSTNSPRRTGPPSANRPSRRPERRHERRRSAGCPRRCSGGPRQPGFARACAARSDPRPRRPR